MIQKITNHLIIGLIIILSTCKSAQQNIKAKKLTNISDIDTKGENEIPSWYVEKNEYGYHPERKRHFKLHHTKLEVSFDWQKQQLHGIATLTLAPYQYPQNTVILDAKGFDIHEVKLIKEGQEKNLNFSYNNLQLQISLDKNYINTENFDLLIRYTAKPNELPKGGSKAITDDRGLYFINPEGKDKNKPSQIWTQGETEASSCWFPTFDAPNIKSSQEIFIRVDTNFVTLSNGKIIGSENNGDGTRTDYWKQEKVHAPYLFMMVIGNFSIVKDQWKGLPVHYYVEPAYKKYAKNIFGNTPEMMTFFSELLKYPYPWDKYHQVVVRDYVSGAMENTSASVFMEELQVNDHELIDRDWDDIIAHELFHQWFGNLVTCESWSNLTLNEGFATYSEYLWFEYKHGFNNAEIKRNKELMNYLSEANVKHVDLIRYHYGYREDMFDNHSYAKGSLILHLLRKYVGDKAFFKALHIYLKDNAFEAVEIHHLRIAFEEVTGEDLNWFFNQWFLSSGHPELYIKDEYKNGYLSLTVLQRQNQEYTPIYRLPLKIAYWIKGKKYTKEITISKKEENFKFSVSDKPELVLFDTEHIIPGIVDHLKTTSNFIAQFHLANNILKKLESLQELDDALKETGVLNIYLEALKASEQAIRLKAIEVLNEYGIRSFNVDTQKEIIKNLKILARNDSYSAIRANALAALIKINAIDNLSVQRALEDSSYLVASEAIFYILENDKNNSEKIINDFENIDNDNIVSTIAKYYASEGTSNKYEWFLEKIQKAKRSIMPILISYLGEYLSQQDKNIQLQGIELLYECSHHSSPNVRLTTFYSINLLKENKKAEKILQDLLANEKNQQLKMIYKKILEEN